MDVVDFDLGRICHLPSLDVEEEALHNCEKGEVG